MGRRHRRSKVTRVVNLVKRIIAFFFSHVGLCALVVGYALLGAVVFRAVEGPHEKFIQSEVTAARRRAVAIAWNATFNVNKLDREQWERTVYEQTKIFQKRCMWAIRRGYDGKEFGVSAQWTFTGSFLYSLTVITTIGYGNTAAKTYFGKTLTILFAIIGIPLMLLFLTNIGDVMAKIFRFLYARSIRLKYRLILWHKRRRAAKIRRANSLVARLTRASANKAYLSATSGHDFSLESLGATAAAVNNLPYPPALPINFNSMGSIPTYVWVKRGDTDKALYKSHQRYRMLYAEQTSRYFGSWMAFIQTCEMISSKIISNGGALIWGLRVSRMNNYFSNNNNALSGLADVHELLAVRAHLDQLEVKESVEAQLQRITVPLSLVLLTMLAYLVAGSVIFCLWESWTFLDSFYFCYISLTTIGFGDKFPGTSVGNDKEAQEKLVITSVYLLFGMALLAMCFNLAQEEVVNKVAWLANKFHSKDDDDEYE